MYEFNKCKTTNCCNATQTKGLCRKCYQRALKRAHWENKTWEELLLEGIENIAKYSASHYNKKCSCNTNKQRNQKMKCVIPDCNRESACRGLCWPCYQAALRYIKTGKATWESLETLGYALPSLQRRGGNSFMKHVVHNNLPIAPHGIQSCLMPIQPSQVASDDVVTTYNELETKGDTTTLLKPLEKSPPWSK